MNAIKLKQYCYELYIKKLALIKDLKKCANNIDYKKSRQSKERT